MGSIVQDVKFGLRMLRKSPGFSALAILTFALGIGVNVAIFSVVDAIALRPLSVVDAGRIVKLVNEDVSHPDRGDSSSWIEAQRFDTERALAAVTAVDRRAVIVKQGGDAHRLLVNVVANNYFDVFRVAPTVGRVFTTVELAAPDASPVAVLSYDYWRRQYNSDPNIVGRTITASDVACVIVGILPRTFRGTELFLNPDIYVPISTWLAMAPGDRVRLERPQARQLELFGRLRPGVTPAQAAAALALVQRRLAVDYPREESGRRIGVKFESDTRGRNMRLVGTLLLAVAALVLLIAAVNVANLLLARGEVRRAEIITRIALGASPARAARQLLTETFVLALAGAAGAALFANWIIGLLALLTPPSEFPIGFDFRLDLRVLTFGGGAALISIVLAGVLPAFAASRGAIALGIKDGAAGGARSRGRWRDAIVAGQVAVTVVLLVAAGLLVRTLVVLRGMDPGFDPRGNVVIATLDVRKLDLQHEHAYYRTMLERFRTMPGIDAATVASRIPLWGSGGGAALLAWIPGLPASDRDGIRIGFAVVGPGYFSTLGTRILRGRAITDADNEGAARAVVLNQSAAHILWPNEDAVGKRFRVNGATGREVEVVGVAQNGRYLEMTEPQRAYMFLPLFQEAQIFGSRWGAEVVVVRSSQNIAAAKAVQETLRGIDRDVAVLSVTTMDEQLRSALYTDRLTVQLIGSMGILGLVLAAIGLFGVVSYSVTRRTREIGVRIAIGANPAAVFRLVLARAALIAGSGIAVGVALALAGGHLLASVLYGVSVRDPTTYCAAIGTMAVVALVAAAIPAHRAASVDPLQALRAD
jgi:putative ABC transport system permease protein